MKSFAFALALLLVSSSVYAEEEDLPKYANPFEAQCREDLSIGHGEIQPGIALGNLRRCIRLRTAESKRPTVRQRSTSKIERSMKTKERELKKQKENLKNGVTSTFGGNPFEKICREKMGLAAKVVLPGPQLGQLRRCINRESAIEAKESRSIKRRASVLERQQMIHKKILQKEIGKEVEEQKKRSETYRSRKVQRPPSTRFQHIRDAGRARTDFHRQRAEGSRTVRRNNASACRRVDPKEWAACIREALGGQEN